MDTSNNQNPYVDQELAISHLFGLTDCNFTPVSLTSENWIRVVAMLINECKESLPYFHKFKELGQILNNTWRDDVGWPQVCTITFCDNVDEKTRVLQLFNLQSRKERLSFKLRRLLLTQQGSLLECVINKRADDPPRESDQQSPIWHPGSEVVFSPVLNKQLMQFLTEERNLVRTIASLLCEVIEEGIKRREHQLRSLHEASRTISRVRDMIMPEFSSST